MKVLYLCEYCGKQFINNHECIKHEVQHIDIAVLKKRNKDAIICPQCDGKGLQLGKTGYFECNVCGGKKLVFRKIKKTYEYKQIEL